MPVNDTTTNRSYQKPNIANTLADDVGRLRSALDAIDTDMANKESTYTITTTATSKALANRERCTVTAAGQTITLPATPNAGWEVTVTIAGSFVDTVLARNGSNIMSLAENMVLNIANSSTTLYYVDAALGWRII